jgi:hypothetical protein
MSPSQNRSDRFINDYVQFNEELAETIRIEQDGNNRHNRHTRYKHCFGC